MLSRKAGRFLQRKSVYRASFPYAHSTSTLDTLTNNHQIRALSICPTYEPQRKFGGSNNSETLAHGNNGTNCQLNSNLKSLPQNTTYAATLLKAFLVASA